MVGRSELETSEAVDLSLGGADLLSDPGVAVTSIIPENKSVSVRSLSPRTIRSGLRAMKQVV